MKSVSAVIAVVLIVIITIALVALTYTFSMTLFKTASSSAEQMTTKTTEAGLTSFRIDLAVGVPVT